MTFVEILLLIIVMIIVIKITIPIIILIIFFFYWLMCKIIEEDCEEKLKVYFILPSGDFAKNEYLCKRRST